MSFLTVYQEAAAPACASYVFITLQEPWSFKAHDDHRRTWCTMVSFEWSFDGDTRCIVLRDHEIARLIKHGNCAATIELG